MESSNVKPILQEDDPFLRQIAKPLPEELFNTSELATMLKDMGDALALEPDGVALAANQIGIPYRIFVVRHDRTLPLPEPTEDQTKQVPPPIDLGVFINPEFVKSSRRREEMDEGCLSVKGIFGTTVRHERATIRAYGADGKKFERGAGGLLAQIFQHEIDHLNGILFIDHAHELIDRRHIETKEGEKEEVIETL
jgi:peptide deformylase